MRTRDQIRRLGIIPLGKWQNITLYYPNNVTWGDKYVKRKIQQTSQGEGAERNRDRRELENR